MHRRVGLFVLLIAFAGATSSAVAQQVPAPRAAALQLQELDQRIAALTEARRGTNKALATALMAPGYAGAVVLLYLGSFMLDADHSPGQHKAKAILGISGACLALGVTGTVMLVGRSHKRREIDRQIRGLEDKKRSLQLAYGVDPFAARAHLSLTF